MSCKRILVRRQRGLMNGLWQEGHFLELECVSDQPEGARLNQIRTAKVKNIVKNINAAFLELGGSQAAYYDLAAHSAGERAVKAGDELVVQICAEAVKTKAPMVTQKLTMNGRYVVLTWKSPGLRCSSKIRDEEWKGRMETELRELLTEDCGLILRTNAYGAASQDILEEGRRLRQKLDSLLRAAPARSCYSLLYDPPAEWMVSVRDTYDLEETVTDDPEIYQQLKGFFEEWAPELLPSLRLYQDGSLSLAACYGLDSAVSEALQERVWLKSGAYLVIQPTEAMTVIDVNTGKAIQGKRTSDETFWKINQEAAAEVARQLRLRNLSGIIMADFINMRSGDYKKQLLAQLRRLVQADPVQTSVVDMTRLELVEITRKKLKKPLAEAIAALSEI
ncbi:ribonuclease E/G [Cuneatibacter caecimuris]|uniref:Ribonuclease G n=1 Tax=Cuneatibacter caecimuris TaxID=1796618 RepID=A0A4Q7PM87_9FIRM|nr:ribonuclease E/G [Cuneatibacter caecimuris]RZT01954.1 ribonuclease G [Cuneatibacter caecimuris]